MQILLPIYSSIKDTKTENNKTFGIPNKELQQNEKYN